MTVAELIRVLSTFSEEQIVLFEHADDNNTAWSIDRVIKQNHFVVIQSR